jgi:hypothetical protein
MDQPGSKVPNEATEDGSTLSHEKSPPRVLPGTQAHRSQKIPRLLGRVELLYQLLENTFQ